MCFLDATAGWIDEVVWTRFWEVLPQFIVGFRCASLKPFLLVGCRPAGRLIFARA